MKKISVILITSGFLLAAAGVAYGVNRAATTYLASESNPAVSKDAAPASCSGEHATHTVIIHNEAMDPSHTYAPQCDKLTIINADPKTRVIAFGVHDKHVAYDGVTETILASNESVTVTLNQTGTFLFHDHDDETVAGEFTVTAQ